MFSYKFSELQEQIQYTARKFAQEEILPGVIERDKNSLFPHEILKKMGDLGFMGFMTSPDWGGSGLDAVSYVLTMEEIAKVEASVGIFFSVHNSLVCWILEHYGTNEQKENFLRPLATGEKLGSFCLSEPNAGSDATRQQTSCEKQGDNWIINGMKNWISSGHNADIHIVFAQSDPELRHKGICCFIVDKDTKGFEPQKPEEKMGMRSSDTCSIALNNVIVPEGNLIGKVGEGFKIAMNSLNSGRIGIAAQGVGVAAGAFDIALKYSTERKAFGKIISKHQAIQFKLAQMSMKIEAARALTLKAADLKDRNENYILASAEAKLFSSTTAVNVTKEAIQVLGGYGYTREYHVERMYRDAKVLEIYEGTSEVQHIVIARELLRNI